MFASGQAALSSVFGAVSATILDDACDLAFGDVEGEAAHYLAFVQTSSMSWRIVRRLTRRIRRRLDVIAPLAL